MTMWNCAKRLGETLLTALMIVSVMGCGEKKAPAVEEKKLQPAVEPVKIQKIEEPLPQAKRLVLIVIDTMRADRLGCYGYDKPVTPMLDKLAKESVLFERFYAASPWTAPSFGTIFTGVSPVVHRTGKWLKQKEPGTQQIGAVVLHPLNPGVATLAELVGDAPSSAFMTNAFLHEKLGFARGFDHYDYTISKLVGIRRADEVTKLAMEWLVRHKNDESFLQVVHYMDPHTAYEPIPIFKEQFAPGAPPTDFVKAPFGPSKKDLRGYKPTTAEKNYIKGLYNGEVRLVDEQIGALIKAMDTLDMLDDTWVVVTSDHGEEHFDHGDFNHGFQYEDEVVRVPLLIRAPGGRWGANVRVGFTASHVDLVPTFLEFLGIPAPDYLEGKSLVPLMKGEEQSHRPAYMEYQLFGRQHYAYFDGRYKLVKTEDGKRAFLYDLQKDPGERLKQNRKHKAFGRLEKEMEAYRATRAPLLERLEKPAPDAGALPDDVTEALKNLGYIEE